MPTAWQHVDGTTVHNDCLTNGDTHRTQEDPDWIPIHEHTPTDRPNHCNHCFEVIHQPLTQAGLDYVVREIVRAWTEYREEGTVPPIAGRMWVDAYDVDYDLTEEIGDRILTDLTHGPLNPHPVYRPHRLLIEGREAARAGRGSPRTGGDPRGEGPTIPEVMATGWHPARFNPEL